MYTIQLTDHELATARRGMTAFLHDFGHDESETIDAIRSVLARLDAAQPEAGDSTA